MQSVLTLRRWRRLGWLALSAPAVHAGSMFLAISLLAHFTSPGALGDYVLGFAVGAPVFMFLSARQRLVLGHGDADDAQTWTFVGARLLMAGLGVTGIVMWGFGWLPLTTAITVSLIALAKACEAISDICYAGLFRAGALQQAQHSQIERGLALSATLAVSVPLSRSAIAAAAAMVAIWLTWTLRDLRALQRLQPFQRPSWRAVCRTAGLPLQHLGITALLGSLGYYVPRYFLAARGAAELGYFGALSVCGLLVLMVSAALADVLIPIASQRIEPAAVARRVDAGRRLYFAVLALGAAATASLLLLGRPALNLLFGADYAGHLDTALLLVAAGTLSGIAACQAHLAVLLNIEIRQAAVTVVAFAVLLAACAVWIPTGGLLAAAAAELIYAMTAALLTEWALLRARRRHPTVASATGHG